MLKNILLGFLFLEIQDVKTYRQPENAILARDDEWPPIQEQWRFTTKDVMSQYGERDGDDCLLVTDEICVDGPDYYAYPCK